MNDTAAEMVASQARQTAREDAVRSQAIEQFWGNDDIVIDDDATVDTDCHGGAWVDARVWIAEEDA